MQRLILQYTSTDGYTYSCENTLPFVYNSKQDALDDFLTILMQREEDEKKNFEQKVQLSKQMDKYRATMNSLQEKVNKINQGNKEVKERGKATLKSYDEAAQDYLKKSQESRNLEASFPDNFSFGGQELAYSEFFYYSDHKMHIDMPDMYTLDEFFEEVDKKNLQVA